MLQRKEGDLDLSTQNPRHYSRWKIEPIEFIRANKLDALRANIIKYIMRYDDKDGMVDLEKAQQYLDYLKEDWRNSETPTPSIVAGAKLLKDLYARVERPCYTEEGLIAAERALYEREKEEDYASNYRA